MVSGNTYDGPDLSATGILIGNPYTLSLTKNTVTGNDSDIYVLQDQGPAWVYCGNPTDTCTNPAAAGTTFTFTKNTASSATNVDANPRQRVRRRTGPRQCHPAHHAPENTANSDPDNGISLYGSTGVPLQKNIADSDGNGIYLGSGTVAASATANSLLNNTSPRHTWTASWPTSPRRATRSRRTR